MKNELVFNFCFLEFVDVEGWRIVCLGILIEEYKENLIK